MWTEGVKRCVDVEVEILGVRRCVEVEWVGVEVKCRCGGKKCRCGGGSVRV